MAADIVTFHPKSETAPHSSVEPRLLSFRPKPELWPAGNAKLHKGLDRFLATTNYTHVRMFVSEILCPGLDHLQESKLMRQIDPGLNMGPHELLDQVLSRVGAQRVKDSFRSFKGILARPVPKLLRLEFRYETTNQFHELLTRGNRARGALKFEDMDRPHGRLMIDFQLWRVDEKFSELSLSGLGVDQRILVRRIVHKTGIQWRFYCSQCERLRFRELYFYFLENGPGPAQFICTDCPEHERNWESWRWRGPSYFLNEMEIEQATQN